MNSRQKSEINIYPTLAILNLLNHFLSRVSPYLWGYDGLKTRNFGVFWPLSGYQTTIIAIRPVLEPPSKFGMVDRREVCQPQMWRVMRRVRPCELTQIVAGAFLYI